MAELREGIDTDSIPDEGGFELLEKDIYPARIEDTKIKPTKKGNGEMLVVEYTISAGDYKGRKLWENLCLFHESKKAQNFARRRFKQLCRAVGITGVVDETTCLHGLELYLDVGVEPGSGGYGDKNCIDEYIAADEREEEPGAAWDKEAEQPSFDDDEIPF